MDDRKKLFDCRQGQLILFFTEMPKSATSKHVRVIIIYILLKLYIYIYIYIVPCWMIIKLLFCYVVAQNDNSWAQL
jgi:hypothetical protein